MKKFLIKLSVFLIIIILADIILGQGLRIIVNGIKVGGQGRDNYIANEAKEDVLVFGSSRAVHHYNTQMIGDSLGLTAYNCGEDGSGIIFNYGRLAMIKERHHPQVIIYDVIADFDLFKNANHKYIGGLKAHYEKEVVRDIISSVDKTEKYKMLSKLYRYNSVFLQNIFVYFTGKSHSDGIKGFRPLVGELNKMKIKETPVRVGEYEYDDLKIDYLNRFIELAGDAKLFFVISPVWSGIDTEQVAPIRKICEMRGVPFLDFSNDKKYVHNDIYFVDGMHLNSIGADEFTRDVINAISF